MAQPHRRRVLGIRTSSARAEPLDALDKTHHGTYWFDLRTRRPAAAITKRSVDVLGSLLLIAAAAPRMLLIIALVKATSPGPAVFIQRRIGFRCNEFGMYKFRTMVVNAEEQQRVLAEQKGGEFFKLASDPRVTPVGRALRRFSLDELPQLFNVLEGTMSLVGPRPLLVSDLEKFPLRGQMRRFSVRPGMTGLWQVSGRSLTTDAQRMELDREYVNRWSLWLDFKILLRTVGVVLTGRGAT
jgi:lipopolysaccharide/colanic/teichoic acid biosynthesis glycosyltransferase